MLANYTALISKMLFVSSLVIEQGQSSGAINTQKGMKDLYTMLHLYICLYNTNNLIGFPWCQFPMKLCWHFQ